MKVLAKILAVDARFVGAAENSSSTMRHLFLDTRKLGRLRSRLAVGILAFAGGLTVSWIGFLIWGFGKITRFW
jgi:hypothetical protein